MFVVLHKDKIKIVKKKSSDSGKNKIYKVTLPLGRSQRGERARGEDGPPPPNCLQNRTYKKFKSGQIDVRGCVRQA